MTTQRWQFGNYTFRINPSGHDLRMDVVGDDVRTLSGAVISQPTGVTEEVDVQSVFYQPRTRIIKAQSMPNAERFTRYNNKWYVLSAEHNAIDAYDDSMTTITQSISLASIFTTPATFCGFAVDQQGYFWVAGSTDGSTSTVYKLDSNGQLQGSWHPASSTVVLGGNVPNIGICKDITLNYSGNLVALMEDGTLYVYLPLTNNSTVQDALPYKVTYLTPVSSYGGVDWDGEYLIVGAWDYDNHVIFHIDAGSYGIVNVITTDGINQVDDVSCDGSYYYVLNIASKTIQIISGNTVLVDLAQMEKQMSSGYLLLTDYRNITQRVGVVSYSKTRIMGYEQMYNVSLTFNRVDRGL